MATRLVAVPDTDEELLNLLGRLEEVLLALVPDEGDDDLDAHLPPGIDAEALAAVQDIMTTVGAAERGPTAPLFAADAHFELIALRFVQLDEDHLAAVGAAVAGLGLGLATGDDVVAEVLLGFADDADKPADLVTGFARAHGLLDLAADCDTPTLARRLARAAGDLAPVVLTPAEEAATTRPRTGPSSSSTSTTRWPVSSTAATDRHGQDPPAAS